MNLLASLPCASRQDEAFLVGADRRADHFGRDVEERCLEFAHQHDRPFDQAGDLLEQALVLDQLEPLREGEVLGVGEDDGLAPVGVEHDLGLLQGVDIILEAAHLDRRGRHEAMAVGRIARRHAVRPRRERSPRLVLRAERAENARAAGAPSAARPAAAEAAPQRIDFGQGKARMIAGRISAITSSVVAAGLLDHRDVELALLGVLLDPRVLDAGKPGALEEARDRRLRRADARALALLAHVGCAAGRPTTCSVSRRGVAKACAPS